MITFGRESSKHITSARRPVKQVEPLGVFGPEPDYRPHRLAEILRDHRVAFRIGGSIAAGGPGRDLDIALTLTADNLCRVRTALAAIAIGDWERSLEALEGGRDGPVTITTRIAVLDIWPDVNQSLAPSAHSSTESPGEVSPQGDATGGA